MADPLPRPRRPARTTARSIPDAPSPLRALRADPRFESRFDETIGLLVLLYRQQSWLNRIFNDRGRALGGIIALYLHHVTLTAAGAPGLTITRFQTLCTTAGICSPGRAAALLSLMRLMRLVEPGRAAADRRVRSLVPTEKLVRLQWQRWDCLNPGIGLLLNESEMAALRRLRGTPALMAALLRRMGEKFLGGFRILDHTPELAAIAERNGGLLLMCVLCIGLPAPRADIQDSTIAISVSALARQLGISRAHLRKLLGTAADAGLLRAAANDEIVVTRRLQHAAREFFAAVFLLHAEVAAVALADLGASHARHFG